MRLSFLITPLIFVVASLASANTYNNCTVSNVFVNEASQNLVQVTLSCNASDAMSSGTNCTSGSIKSNAFVFDASTTNGKTYLALVSMAMATGKSIYASTYGSCPTSVQDTLWIYSLRANNQ